MHPMLATRALILLSSFFIVNATPLSAPENHAHLYPRTTPCDPAGTPQLYQDYYRDACPPALRLNPDGTCPVDGGSYAGGCNSYCETKQSFTYDEEKPVVDNPYCHGPLTCTISTSKAFTYTYTASFNTAWTKAFTAGITGGFSYEDATAQLQATVVALKEGQCGYFTFLPLLQNCGNKCPLSLPISEHSLRTFN